MTDYYISPLDLSAKEIVKGVFFCPFRLEHIDFPKGTFAGCFFDKMSTKVKHLFIDDLKDMFHEWSFLENISSFDGWVCPVACSNYIHRRWTDGDYSYRLHSEKVKKMYSLYNAKIVYERSLDPNYDAKIESELKALATDKCFKAKFNELIELATTPIINCSKK